MSKIQDRIERLKLMMSEKQRRRYAEEAAVLASRYDSGLISDEQMLFIAERIILDREIDAADLVDLKPTKAALAAIETKKAHA